MSITIEDIRNPQRQSGFDQVRNTKQGSKPFQAQSGTNAHFVGEKTNRWQGPCRATAEEAAQDYCDYVNGNGVTRAVPLKAASHPAPPARPDKTDEERRLRARLKEIEAEKNKDRQGFVYLIGMKTDPSAVKVGFSYDPPSRPKSLQTGNPRVLVVIRYFAGTEEDEKRLHQKYITDNILQEWFVPSRALLGEFGSDWSDFSQQIWALDEKEKVAA